MIFRVGGKRGVAKRKGGGGGFSLFFGKMVLTEWVRVVQNRAVAFSVLRGERGFEKRERKKTQTSDLSFMRRTK